MPGMNSMDSGVSILESIQIFIIFLMSAFFAVSGTFG